VPLGTGTQLSSTGVSFDAAGRLVSESSYSGDTTSGGATSDTHTQTTRSYDAENHLLSTQYVSQGKSYDAALIEYGWGPSGHPLRIGSAQNIQRTIGNWTPPTAAQVQYDTLHWDGSQLLFETNPAGQVDAINVGTLGAILPLDLGYNGLTFWDRQSDGSVAFCHNATGAAGGGTLLPYTLTMHLPPKLVSGTADINPCISPNTAVHMPTSVEWWASPGLTGTVPVPAYVGTGGVLGMPRTDGIDDGLDVIQGVRSYDAQAGIWTSPDAYAGTVNDPGTQKSYMWNNNNPISYSDPSGYEGSCDGCQGMPVPGIPVPQGARNLDVYVQVEGSFLIVMLSGTVTGRNGAFWSIGDGVNGSKITPQVLLQALKNPAALERLLGFSVDVGIVIPNKGKNAGNVVGGWTTSFGVGDFIGIQVIRNHSGKAIGIGFTTPGGGVSRTYGRRLGSKPKKVKNNALLNAANAGNFGGITSAIGNM
ncbi:MAG: RHS repeat-associated core domain-containing protein, partial [Acidithiobacillus ferrivorans]